MIPSIDQFINESKSGAEQLRSLLRSRYDDFVKRLSAESKDPKLLAAIEAGRFDGKPEDEKIEFPSSPTVHVVRDLIPTQWEVDVDKSLAHQLSYEAGKTDQLVQILGNTPILIKSPLIILNGRYVIDGHHRWSQVYAMNPSAKMLCYNLRTKERIAPIDFLKTMQLAIATVAEIEPQKVDGRNLFELKKNDALLYMLHGKGSIKGFNGISNGSLMAFQMKRPWIKTVEDVAELVWSNIEQMQEASQPIEDAPDRNVMPQTDTAIGQAQFKTSLKSGAINYKEPLEANERRSIPDFDHFLDESQNSPDVYIANRLSKGNQVFPAEIHFEPNGITIRIPGLINDKSRFIAFSDIDGIGVISPLVGWSTIELWHGGVKMEAHGFTKSEAKAIKDRIEAGKSTKVNEQESSMSLKSLGFSEISRNSMRYDFNLKDSELRINVIRLSDSEVKIEISGVSLLMSRKASAEEIVELASDIISQINSLAIQTVSRRLNSISSYLTKKGFR